MKTMTIYAVSVTTMADLTTNATRISQEAYDSYDAARSFIEGRGDSPQKIGDYTFVSATYRYQIHPLTVHCQ